MSKIDKVFKQAAKITLDRLLELSKHNATPACWFPQKDVNIEMVATLIRKEITKRKLIGYNVVIVEDPNSEMVGVELELINNNLN